MSARRTPPSAGGEPVVWVAALALVASLGAIVALLSLIVAQAAWAFWPRDIQALRLTDGSVLLGVAVRDEPASERSSARTLYRVGNRDLAAGSPTFRWIDEQQIAERSTPADAVLVERTGWGVWLGRPGRLLRIDSGQPTALAAGAEVWPLFEQLHADALDRRARVRALETGELATVHRQREAWRLRVADAERRSVAGREPILPVWAWGLAVLAAAAGAVGGWLAGARFNRPITKRVLFALAVVGLLLGVLESPWSGARPTELAVAELRSRAILEVAALDARAAAIEEDIAAIETEDARFRVELLDESSGRFAPESLASPDVPMRVSQVVRVVSANRLDTQGRVAVLLDRWAEFLTDEPREANAEGGVFPVIFGTISLTILLSLAVVPLGVIAALYLREYARQGIVTSVLRIAVNNLAGVPSVVYGVFGLGFFCYTVGGFIDEGPAAPMPRLPWWILIAALSVVVAAALSLVAASSARARASARWLTVLCWAAAGALALVVLARAPYFDGFFAARAAEGSPTFGTRGILWASLTLALLTLPVVIVATEEAIAAVPRSMREGSYGCGASKWQTVRRIVLPGAMPGIMTGTILAMARGAGEVAPLMLVGAVKLAPELPITTNPPFLHLDGTFMHMGFHIFDLGYMSQDVEATRPLVWTTTLLLIAIVLFLNSVAIVVRSRLRGRLVSAAV